MSEKTKKQLAYNDIGVCVDQFIEDGRTLFFTCKQKAINYADTIRSYVYPVQDGDKKPIGYCVPK